MRDTNIFIFGDSITYGACDSEFGGWVNRLRISLENNKDNIYYNTFNLGISGEISEELVKRFNHEFLARYKANTRTIIIFAIGINDTLDINGKDLVKIEAFKNNILELIKQAKHYTDEICFIGLTKIDERLMIPVSWDNERSYFNEKIIKFDNEIELICKDKKIKYIYMYDLLSVDELDDGLHPNSEGHKKMFERISNNMF